MRKVRNIIIGIMLYSCTLCFAGSSADEGGVKEVKLNKMPFHNAEWLRKGLISAAVVLGDRGNSTGEQLASAVEINAYVRGFLAGMNMACLADLESKSRLYYPPEAFKGRRALESLQNFLNENRNKIKPYTAAYGVLAAWYYSNHPAATEEHKYISMGLLEDKPAKK